MEHEFNNEYGESERMNELFGSILKSMFTLFQIQTLESWSEAIARPVMRRRPELSLFFISYVFFVTICVLNVIVAIVIESVIKKTLVENDIEKQQQIAEHRKMRVLDLQTLFIKAAGEDGMLTREEWLNTLSSPEIGPLLIHLDLPLEVA